MNKTKLSRFGRYKLLICIAIAIIIIGFVYSLFLFENRTTIVYKINIDNFDPPKSIEIIENKLNGVMELNEYFFNEKENKIEIILPNGLQPDAVKNALSVRSSFRLQELVNNNWKSTELNESYIVSAENFFDTEGTPHTKIVFNDAGKNLLADITEENIGKNLQMTLDDKIVFSGFVGEKIENGTIIIPHEKIKNMYELTAGLIFAGHDKPLELIEENQEKRIFKKSVE